MDIKETREEIIKRSKKLAKKRQKRRERFMESGCGILIIALLIIVQQVPEKETVLDMSANYGTMVLGAEAGIYVLVGMICFFLGVLITLIAVNKRKGNDEQ